MLGDHAIELGVEAGDDLLDGGFFLGSQAGAEIAAGDELIEGRGFGPGVADASPFGALPGEFDLDRAGEGGVVPDGHGEGGLDDFGVRRRGGLVMDFGGVPVFEGEVG